MRLLYHFAAILILVCPLKLFSQNLVPNPSFEDYDNCPAYYFDLTLPSAPTYSVDHWHTASGATPDYFNPCSVLFDVPANVFGYQVPRTGDAYMGAYTKQEDIYVPEYREYIEAKLTAPLVAGHQYYVSYWLNLSGSAEIASRTVAGTDQMGAYFSTAAEERPGSGLPMDDLTPQVKSPAGLVFTDTASWRQVSGTFTAAGMERWVTLGNFTPKTSLTMTAVTGAPSASCIYYYYDDVCVLDLDGAPVAYTKKDTSLCGVVSLYLAGRPGATQYLWQDGDTVFNKNIVDSGIYWVKSTNTDSCLFYLDSFIVSGQISSQVIDLGPDTFLCDNTPIQLNAYSALFDTYTWSTGDTTSSINVTAPGTYYVAAHAICNKGSDTIVVYPKPVLVPLPEALVECDEYSVKIGSFTPGVSYLWNTGETACCIDVTASGTYTLKATTACGEVFHDSITVNFTDCDYCILVPSAFSPNDDGLNDAFELMINCPLDIIDLKIFNRWGELIFNSNGKNKSWDGKIRGAMADIGVYYYYLSAHSTVGSGKKIIKKGDITLLR